MNNKYPHYQGTNIHIIKEQLHRNEEELCWMSHLAPDQNSSKHLWVLLYSTVTTPLFLNKKAVKEDEKKCCEIISSFELQSKRGLDKKDLRVFSHSWMVQKREMGSGILHTAQGCKLSVWGEVCVCLWALHLISPSVYSVGLDISTPTMRIGSMCALESIKSVEETHSVREFIYFKYTKG